MRHFFFFFQTHFGGVILLCWVNSLRSTLLPNSLFLQSKNRLKNYRLTFRFSGFGGRGEGEGRGEEESFVGSFFFFVFFFFF